LTTGPALRLDKWLWFTRLSKNRENAAALCEARHMRLSGRLVDKAHAPVRIGDVLSLPRGAEVLVVKVLALPQRRLGAPEAARCYDMMWSSRSGSEVIEASRQSRYDPAIQPPDPGA
jgi:ribosome-associated heat shock protein Hsp15